MFEPQQTTVCLRHSSRCNREPYEGEGHARTRHARSWTCRVSQSILYLASATLMVFVCLFHRHQKSEDDPFPFTTLKFKMYEGIR